MTNKQNIYNLIAAYLENGITEEERIMLIRQLEKSARIREILNLSAAGSKSFNRSNQPSTEDNHESRSNIPDT